VQTLGIIGGSGIYGMPGLQILDELEVQTPFGAPSSPLVVAELDGVRLVFLARHGTDHQLPPHEVNYRANICALKKSGVQQVVSLSAVGSMKDGIHPGDVVVVDQYIDWTRKRVSTFFEDGIAAHVSLADPVCSNLAERAAEAAEAAGAQVHRGGTYICMEGPQFSTRAESLLYRSWGVSVIGMTAMPEAKLAREAELPYATIAFATDYDCWHQAEEDVSVEAVLGVLKSNAHRAQDILRRLPALLPDPKQSPASQALKHAIITKKAALDAEIQKRLGWLLNEQA